MQKDLTVLKDNANVTQVDRIKNFAELGATKKLFDLFWAGQYLRIIDTAMTEHEHAFEFEKSIKIGSTSWLTGRVLENSAYLIYALYKEVAPDNSDLRDALKPDDLLLVTTLYNVRFANSSPIIITKVHSLLSSLIKNNSAPAKTIISRQEGISLHQCTCGNVFIARCSTVTASCQWCRSKIKKLDRQNKSTRPKHTPVQVKISSVARMTPKRQIF